MPPISGFPLPLEKQEDGVFHTPFGVVGDGSGPSRWLSG